MTPIPHLDVWAAPLLVLAVLGVGAYLVAVADAAGRGLAAGSLGAAVLIEPAREAARAWGVRATTTERPDRATAHVALVTYVACAAGGLAVVPLWEGTAAADLPVGIVVWGTIEALAIVALFLRGWSPNSLQPLVAAYRFVAVGLSYLLLSMFVLIGAALPAESLGLGAIVDSQAGLWNVVRQPLGLPLFLVVALGTVAWGPVAVALGADLSGGTAAESSGRDLLLWRIARAAMVVAFSAMAAATFLGGWHGPWLPGPAWMAVKTLAVAVLLVLCHHGLARGRAERIVTLSWTVLLPLGFLDLVIAGVEALP